MTMLHHRLLIDALAERCGMSRAEALTGGGVQTRPPNHLELLP